MSVTLPATRARSVTAAATDAAEDAQWPRGQLLCTFRKQTAEDAKAPGGAAGPANPLAWCLRASAVHCQERSSTEWERSAGAKQKGCGNRYSDKRRRCGPGGLLRLPVPLSSRSSQPSWAHGQFVPFTFNPGKCWLSLKRTIRKCW